MIRLLCLTYLLFFSFISAFTQPYKFKYYLDKDLASVDSSYALFIGKGFQENNLFLLDCFKKKSGKLFMSAHFKDSSLNMLEGMYQSFHDNEQLEQSGNYSNNLEQGLWITRDTSGRITDSVEFNNGSVLNKRSYRYHKNGKVQSYSMTSGNRVEQLFILYDTSGTIIQADNEDKIFTKTEVPAQFPGGLTAWGNFLKKNLKVPDPSFYNIPSGTFTVVVRFVVNREGNVSDIVPETSMGYGMEDEVIRLIKTSKNWIPAKQNGNIVSAYKRQPVTFVIDNGERK